MFAPSCWEGLGAFDKKNKVKKEVFGIQTRHYI